MFTSLTDLHDQVTRDHGAMAATLLQPHAVPCLLLHAAPHSPSHLGGLPTMARDTPWPIRHPPADLADVLDAWGVIDLVETHLPNARPLSFVAQLDLAQIHAAAENAAENAATSPPDLAANGLPRTGRLFGLPRTGRLLVFIDLQIGYFVDGPDACHVIWDQTPSDQLHQHPAPAALTAPLPTPPQTTDHTALDADIASIAQDWADANPDVPFDADAIRATILAAVDQAVGHGDPYVHALVLPAQPVTPQLGYQLPSYSNPEFGPMVADLSGRPWHRLSVEAREDLIHSIDGLAWDTPDHVLAHSFGLPIPDQDDPRDMAPQPPGATNRLLLQLPVPSLLQTPNAEGNFYILIPDDALAAADFSRCSLIFQQT